MVTFVADPSEGIQFFERALTNRTRLGAEASLCVELDVVMLKLQIGLLDEAKNDLEAAKEVLDGISSSESVVFSKFYLASAEFHKVKNRTLRDVAHSSVRTGRRTTGEILSSRSHVLVIYTCRGATRGGSLYASH
jgi:hypothetical protein